MFRYGISAPLLEKPGSPVYTIVCGGYQFDKEDGMAIKTMQKNASGAGKTSRTTCCGVPADHLATEMLFRAEVRKRAYEIFLEHGNVPGSEFDDWLRAEREIKARHGRSNVT